MSLFRQSARRVLSASSSSLRARYVNASSRTFYTNRAFLEDAKPVLQRKVETNNKQEVAFDEPTPIRLHDVTPNPLPKSLAPTHEEDYENNWLTMPTLFERAVGSERAELLNPNIYDELLVELVDVENGVGSSIFNPIIIPSMGDPERVIGCMGECYKGDDIDFDSSEQQFWVMSENSFGVCDECGLFFYLASPKTISRMQIENQLRQEQEEEGTNVKLVPQDAQKLSEH